MSELTQDVEKSPNELSCPICDSSQASEYLNYGEFAICNCENCKVLFTWPLPSDEYLTKFYQGFMYSDGQAGFMPSPKELEQQLQVRIGEIKKLFDVDEQSAKGKRFLDFGGGTGAAFGAARKIGFDAYFFDVDENAISYVEKSFNTSSESMIRDLNAVQQDFDYILCDNVIEHVQEPLGLIKLLHSRLAPGGKLIFKTPMAKNTEMYFCPLVSVAYAKRAIKHNGVLGGLKAYFRPYWHCEPPRHLFGFSDKSLVQAAVRTGISEENISICHYRIGYWSNTFAQRLFRMIKYGAGKKSWMVPLAAIALIPEFFIKLLQLPLTLLNLLSPSGVILVLKK